MKETDNQSFNNKIMNKNNTKKDAVQGTDSKAVETPVAGSVAKAVEAEAQVRRLGEHLPAIQPKPMAFEDVAKAVTSLNTKLRQLYRLDENISNLEAFELKKSEEDLESTANYYAGCKLELTDDNRDSFLLKNPVLIREVVAYLLERMQVKREELKSEIKLPTAA